MSFHRPGRAPPSMRVQRAFQERAQTGPDPLHQRAVLVVIRILNIRELVVITVGTAIDRAGCGLRYHGRIEGIGID